MKVKQLVWKKENARLNQVIRGYIGDLHMFSITPSDEANTARTLSVYLPFYNDYYDKPDIESCKKEAQEILEQFIKQVIE